MAAVVLGELPLDEGDLDAVLGTAVADGGIGAGAHRPSATRQVSSFVEVVACPDELERQRAAGFDLENVSDGQDISKRCGDERGIVEPGSECVDTLHLRVEQMIRRMPVDCLMPVHALRGEHLQCVFADIG